MNPAVSIITPTYNRARLLPRVWASLRKQTLGDFQWIIVDDGSTDDTRGVVENFGDKRIHYVYQRNAGVNVARNRGEREIEAGYVIFLDSDDELHDQHTLAMMVDEIASAPAEIGLVRFTVIDSEGREGLHYMERDRMVTGYADNICEKNHWGEFFPIYKTEVLKISPWPAFNGYEVIRHWRIAKHHPALLVHRPARVYHRAAGDNLTGMHSVIRRSASMTEAVSQLINEHRAAWLEYCPCQLGRYQLYQAMYAALSGQILRAWCAVLSTFRWADRNTRMKAIVLTVTLFLPLALRRWLFIQRATRQWP